MSRVLANGPGDPDQSQVESYQMMLPYLTLSIIRLGSRVKWSNPGKGIAPFPTLRFCSYWKRSLRVTFDYGRQQLYYIAVMNNEIKEL